MKKIKMHKRVCIALGIVLVIAAAAVAVFFLRKPDATSFAGNDKRTDTVALEKMDLTKSVSATGTLESAKSKSVSAGMNNIEVQSVHVCVGDTVKKGDTLVNFDESDLEDALAEAQENLADAESEASRSVSSAQKKVTDAAESYHDDVERLQKNVTQAKEKKAEAKKEVAALEKKSKQQTDDSKKQMLEEQLSKAQEVLEQADNAYENAVAEKEATEKQSASNIENAKENLETTQTNGNKSIKEAKKQVTQAEKSLEKCAVTAPMSGTVTAVNVEEGDVYAGGTMVQIEDTENLVVSTCIDEYDIGGVAVGQRVVILTEATDEEELEGEITFVSPTMASTQGQSTGEQMTSGNDGYEVAIALDKKDERLRPGMTAKCSIIEEEVSEVYAVPYDAVHEKSDGTKFIYVLDKDAGQSAEKTGGGEASMPQGKNSEEGSSMPEGMDREEGEAMPEQKEISVTVGMESDYYVEISGDDLKEGMQVVVPADETDSGESDADKIQDKETEGLDFGGFGNSAPGMGGPNMGNGGGKEGSQR